jgi:hypothetical protein
LFEKISDIKLNIPVFTLYFSTRLRLDQPTDTPPARITSVELENVMVLINLVKIHIKTSTCIEEVLCPCPLTGSDGILYATFVRKR